MRIRIERKNRDGLGSEKFLFCTGRYYDRFARLGAARRDPSGEFPDSPTQTDCGLRIVDCGFDSGASDPQSAIRNPQSNGFNDLLYSTENPLQPIRPHVRQSQLSRLNDGTHFAQCREQSGKLFVVMDWIGLDEPERGTEPNRLADRHPRFHTGMTCERRDLPELARGIWSEQRRGVGGQALMTRLFTAKRDEGNPDAGSERAR